jgi:putative PIN family toxin of toxin-antitoxin system
VTTRHSIRAVLDTNLFVSGLFSTGGTTGRLQDLWLSGVFELAVSEEILQEIKATLQKPYIRKKLFLPEDEIDEIISLIREKALVVTQDIYQTDKIIADPDDNKFLGCALEIKADYIVSGDNHLLSIKHFHGIQIVDAASFIRKITE